MDALAVDLDPRAQRGLAIVKAKGKGIRQIVEGTYLVPSQTLASGGYVVDVTAASCTCPDFVALGGTTGHRCKHIWAVLYVRREVTMPDGSVVVSEKRVTFKRNWSLYNQGQTNEKGRVQVLLHSLCEGIVVPAYKGNGRPSLAVSDVIYGATMKVFTGMSTRRAMTDIEWCGDRGLLGKPPSFSSIFRYMESPTITPLLQVLIAESAAPLAAIDPDKKYAVDSTGFSVGVPGSYCDHKHGAKKGPRRYLKAHVIATTRTHVATYVEPTLGHVSDIHEGLVEKLVSETAKRHELAEVSGDAAYCTKANADIIAKYKAVPYLDFRSNSTGTKGPAAWNKMWHHFSSEQDSYMEHYHRRSNVETVMHQVKARFGGGLKSRTLTACYNEILCKYLAHNLSQVAMAIDTLGLDPKFGKDFTGRAA